MNDDKICRRKFITSRVSKEEKALIHQRAADLGKDASNHIREVLVKEAEEAGTKIDLSQITVADL